MKHPHAELMAQYAQDAMETDKPWKRWECMDSIEVWVSCTEDDMHFTSRYCYRRKPTSTPVDLSVLIDSGIDMEFSSKKQFTEMMFGKLERIDAFGYQRLTRIGTSAYSYCRPRMNHIHAWQGGECPLPEGVLVKIWYRRMGFAHISSSDYIDDWRHDGDYDTNIIAFEVLGLAEGWQWPFED